MEKSELKQMIRNTLLVELAKAGMKSVPVAVSNRHVHLCRADVEKLFGAGYQLRPSKALSQPGQYACAEKIALIGPKGKITDVRVLGPERKETQVEVSVTDSFKLGIKPVARMSGDLAGSPGIVLSGPAGEVELRCGAIISARHLHMSNEEALAYGLKDGDAVSLRKGGVRPMVFENVIVRAGNGHSLEVHLDTDEGNAALIACGDLLEVVEQGNQSFIGETLHQAKAPAAELPPIIKVFEPEKEALNDATVLVTEDIIMAQYKLGVTNMKAGKKTLITPLAKDKANELGMAIEISRE